MRFGHLAAEFERRNGLLPAHRGEAVQELVQPIPGFKMVVQRFHRDPRPYEDGGASQNVRVTVDDRERVRHRSDPEASIRLPIRHPTLDVCITFCSGVRTCHLRRQTTSPDRGREQRFPREPPPDGRRQPSTSSHSQRFVWAAGDVTHVIDCARPGTPTSPEPCSIGRTFCAHARASHGSRRVIRCCQCGRGSASGARHCPSSV